MINPDAEKITLVCDNLNTHNIGSFYEALGKEKAHELANRIEFVYTPKHGSWLDIAEIGINIMTTECLGQRRISELKTILKYLDQWVIQHNKTKKPISWQFTLGTARTKLAHLYPDEKPDPAIDAKNRKSLRNSDKSSTKHEGSDGAQEGVNPESENPEPYEVPTYGLSEDNSCTVKYVGCQGYENSVYQDIAYRAEATSANVQHVWLDTACIDDGTKYIANSCTVCDARGSFTTMIKQPDGTFRREPTMSHWVI